MEKLNITKGEYHTNELETRVECDNRLVATCLDGEGNAFTNNSQNINKQKSLAILFSDAGNTYNQTPVLPSELLRQRDEMAEYLKDLVFRYPNSPHIFNPAKELLKQIENE